MTVLLGCNVIVNKSRAGETSTVLTHAIGSTIESDVFHNLDIVIPSTIVLAISYKGEAVLNPPSLGVLDYLNLSSEKLRVATN